MPAAPGDTLVAYNLIEHPLRSTISDHLYSFRRYGTGRCAYLNLAVRRPPRWIADHDWDTVIFHTSFLGQRWAPDAFRAQLERATPLRGLGRARIALPQDEFLCSRLLCEFIEEFEVDEVMSVAPESEWDKIYEGIDRDRVGISPVLTGYLSEDTVRRIDRILERTPDRPIGIGYRAWEGAPWLGRHGMMKRTVGEVFAQAAPAAGITTDISTEQSGVLSGDDWFRFLARCRYTVGVEGGATILDRDGALKRATEDYLAEHPRASFDEVEAACFPGEDGKLQLFAISPRHLEACATRTCQILVEGSYSGVLRPGEHYIELRRDLSNVGDVLELVRSDSERDRITAAAHRDIVASGRYGYAGFVERVEAAAARVRERRGAAASAAGGSFERRAALADRASWLKVIFLARIVPRVSGAATRVLPRQAAAFLRRLLYGTTAAPGRGSSPR